MKSMITITMNPTIDKSSSIERVESEKKLRCDPPRFDPGGGGLNVARAVKILGGECRAFFTSGGPPGKALELLLQKEDIQTKPYSIKDWTRENLTIYETSSGEQYRFGMPGPELEEKEWNGFLEQISSLDPVPDLIVASGSLPPGVPVDFYGRIAKIANDSGSSMILDTAGEALSRSVQEGVFLLKPNRRELRDLAESVANSISEEEMAVKLVKEGKAEVVVVSMGSQGAIVASRDGVEKPPSPDVPIKSKVGAGDSMVAGITLGLAQGQSLMDSVRYGVAAGAAAVMTSGTQLCRREDVERLYKELQS
jgi:6-phosphofructokinase 2